MSNDCLPPSNLRRCPTGLVIAMTVGFAPLSHASPLALSTAPAGTGYKPPAPNVIVSVDDSGSMGSAGMQTLRDALRDTFKATNVPNGSIRLGWQAMTGCYAIPSSGDCRGRNQVRVLDDTQRSHFMDWVDTLRTQGGTPSHRMLFNAGEYYRSVPSVNSPWAKIPGVQQEPMLACRRSYNLFMTDGGWNNTDSWNSTNTTATAAIGNADGRSQVLGDGATQYDITSNQTRIYRDSYGRTDLPTLADLAFYYWATDLQPSIANRVPKKLVVTGNQNVSTANGSVTLTPDWNPRNDSATWQHMTTYTVGFNAAANWNDTAAAPKFGGDTWTGASFNELVVGGTGAQTWTNPITGNEITRMPELWHMALNSRGKFISAPNAASLAPAFKDILNEIIQDSTAPVTSLAVSTRNTRIDGAAYTTTYDGQTWSGSVVAYNIAAGTGQVSSAGVWGTVPATATQPARPTSTATIMDQAAFSPTARVVLSASTAPPPSGSATPGATTGISWEWGNLSAAQKTELNTVGTVVDTLGSKRLDYLRGSRRDEQDQPVPGPFRIRASRHGDVVNSDVWYTAGVPNAGYTINGYGGFVTGNANRKSMIYVGANDGMLHGFDASTGLEKIAYIPEGLGSRLSALTSPGYVHGFYVDGSPFTADAYVGGAWRTYLAGFTGLGGKGYFVLDVTAPSTFGAANAAATVVLDKTGTASMDADVGYMPGKVVTSQTTPSRAMQITRMNNNRWALIMGNGYNSASEKAVLLVQYLDGDKKLLKLTADNTPGGANGMAPPQLVDLNGDGTPDVAYAGDLKGRLWKFDLSSASEGDWKVAFGGQALYAAKDASGDVQPITTAPAWMFHPDGGILVAFGTGRSLTDADRVDVRTQTLYGIWDKTTHTTTSVAGGASTVQLNATDNSVSGGRASLEQQTISTGSTATTAGNETSLWTVSSNTVQYTGAAAKQGWYIDLPEAGERTLSNPRWLQGRLFTFPTTVPTRGNDVTEETCDPNTTAGMSFLTTLNLLSGAAPSYAVYAYASTPTTGNPSRASDPARGVSTLIGGAGSKSGCIAAPGVECDPPTQPPENELRASWRQGR